MGDIRQELIWRGKMESGKNWVSGAHLKRGRGGDWKRKRGRKEKMEENWEVN